ncbi:glycoside hydrolase family 92 protein [Apiospora phragmitis]|uniref:Glycoside hydrolase family 92 protein n=1 Tax=Apiospora phragmitis TaxID=2905665 RepID=A0ABR1TS83_9PEZI
MSLRYLMFTLAIPGLAQDAVARSVGQAEHSTNTGYDFVDPLIGTHNGGTISVLSNPCQNKPMHRLILRLGCILGMAKAVADSTEDNQGGYASNDSPISGFSHMHDSGTGGASSLQGKFPHLSLPWLRRRCCKRLQATQGFTSSTGCRGSVSARPGYFTIDLISGIRGEITASNHTALYQFTFIGNATGNATTKGAPLSPLLIVDLTDLPDTRSNGSASVDPQTGRMTGTGTFDPSFGLGTYTLHYCVDSKANSTIRDTGVFVNNRAGSEPKNITMQKDNNRTPLPAGTYTWFGESAPGAQITVRVGVSFMSTQQACENAEKEIPNFDFEATLEAAEKAWKDKLSVISVDPSGTDNSYQTIFWSGVYRAMLSPQDYTGENPLWESDEPYYDSYYCIWDSFRSIHPFIALIDPYSQTLMIRSLIDIYRHEGFLPDCRMSLTKGFTQGGSNADIVLTDSFLKNISQGINWDVGYEALVKDAEVEPAVWDLEGRGGLKSWKELGYIPADDFDADGNGLFTRSLSRTVEYAYDDFCIAEVAQALGKQADYEKYLERSGNWYNLWNQQQTSAINGTDTGFKGFLQPRYLNQSWAFQDPAFCSPLMNFTSCYLNQDGGETYEGSAWMYTFFAPHNMAKLVMTLGGPDAFVRRPDDLHESGLLYIGDEQAFLPVYQYHYAGRPGKSAERVHFYVPSQFNTTPAGIPGNDDSGAMGSFVALSMLGHLLHHAPFFASVSITNPTTGKTATIKNVNFDPGYVNIYVQSATLNGEVYTKNYLTHSFFLEGGTLELTLDAKESTTWGTGESDIPPSYGSLE